MSQTNATVEQISGGVFVRLDVSNELQLVSIFDLHLNAIDIYSFQCGRTPRTLLPGTRVQVGDKVNGE